MATPPTKQQVSVTGDVIIVGAGLFGLTLAQKIASETTKSVTIIEKRGHIGGNAFSYFDEHTGIEIHKYGSHLFHTSNRRVWEYVNKFTQFTDYKHKVFTKYRGAIYNMPINLHTISQFYGKDVNPESARKLLESTRIKYSENPKNFEERALSLVGRDIYEAFFKNYTEKQWQTPPADLPGEIFSRLPIRFNLNSEYFEDTYQGLPINGYQAWFDNMIQDTKIEILLNTDFLEIRDSFDSKSKLIIFTGPIDQFYNFRYGQLSWRTLDFEFETLNQVDYQGTSVMNYADNPPRFTRIHEFKHLHPERDYSTQSTVIAREYSRKAETTDEPYYPINSDIDRKTLLKYRDAAAKESNVFFGGRLGSYQYLDMHMAIASALTMFENDVIPYFERIQK
jgi:UDP-galactopyranose mutase